MKYITWIGWIALLLLFFGQGVSCVSKVADQCGLPCTQASDCGFDYECKQTLCTHPQRCTVEEILGEGPRDTGKEEPPESGPEESVSKEEPKEKEADPPEASCQFGKTERGDCKLQIAEVVVEVPCGICDDGTDDKVDPIVRFTLEDGTELKTPVFENSCDKNTYKWSSPSLTPEQMRQVTIEILDTNDGKANTSCQSWQADLSNAQAYRFSEDKEGKTIRIEFTVKK